MPHEAKRLPPLHLKLRVRLTDHMSRREAMRRLRRTVETGVAQRGIEVSWIDWESGEEGKLRGGQYKTPAKVRQALRDFYDAIIHPGADVRIARVED